MKKYIEVTFISILFFTFLIACGQKEEKISLEEIDTEKLESVELKEENIDLVYKLKKGEKFRYRLTTLSSASEKIQADSLIHSTSDQKVIYEFDIEVIDVEDDKTSELSVTISSLKLSAEMNREKIEYDANTEQSEEDKYKFAQYSAIHKIPYRARLTQYGDILEVTRLDKMVDKLMSLQPQQQTLSAEQKSEIAKNIAEGAIRPITQLVFRNLPQTPVAKDSSWVRSYPAQLSVFNVENIATFIVKDFVKVKNEKAEKISAKLTFKYEGQKKGEQEGMKYSFDDPILGGGGSILFNIDKGMLLRSETNTSVEMKATIETKDAMQKAQKIVRTDISKNKNVVELL